MNTTTFPSEAIIGMMTYQIEYRPIKGGDCGRTYHKKLLIVIDSTMTLEAIKSTLLHELLHALHFVFGITSRMSEEKIICNLEMPLLMLLRDNKKLIAWLQR